MSDKPYREQRIADHLAMLREEEREKAMLYDRTIGGELVPRPSKEFIENCIGPMKSDEALDREARAAVDREDRQRWIENERREAVEQSMREHDRAVRERSQDISAPAPSSRVDRIKAFLERTRTQDQGNDRDIGQDRDDGIDI